MFQNLVVRCAWRTVATLTRTTTYPETTVFPPRCLTETLSHRSIPRRLMASSANRDLFYDDIVALSSKKDVVLIDVREPSEIQETGKLPGSTHIPLGEVADALNLDAAVFQEKYGIQKPSQDTPLVFSCRSGKRSLVALDKALSMGFSNSRHYAGGWLDWEKHTK